mmetsp:Transcript_10410/g.22931  ORF Transcript_10410/g.22931 Transcript_10410/m.22931 type:complete len:299 (+) Transcript_10410:829-1725(+)
MLNLVPMPDAALATDPPDMRGPMSPPPFSDSSAGGKSGIWSWMTLGSERKGMQPVGEAVVVFDLEVFLSLEALLCTDSFELDLRRFFCWDFGDCCKTKQISSLLPALAKTHVSDLRRACCGLLWASEVAPAATSPLVFAFVSFATSGLESLLCFDSLLDLLTLLLLSFFSFLAFFSLLVCLCSGITSSEVAFGPMSSLEEGPLAGIGSWSESWPFFSENSDATVVPVVPLSVRPSQALLLPEFLLECVTPLAAAFVSLSSSSVPPVMPKGVGLGSTCAESKGALRPRDCCLASLLACS